MTALLQGQEIFIPFETLVLPPQPAYDIPEDDEPGFRYADAEIKAWFAGKHEEEVGECELVFMRHSGPDDICENELAECLSEAPPLTMSQVRALLWRHLVRLPSPVLLTGWPNVFHVLDKSNERRSIQARWFPSHCGWDLRAHELTGRSPIYRYVHIALPTLKGPQGGPLLKEILK